MFGNGAAIGIVLTTTRLSPTKAALRIIPKGLIRHSILRSRMRKSACIAAARSFAMTSIAHATSLAPVARARSTPAQITWVFDAFDCRRTSRSAQARINSSDGQLFSSKQYTKSAKLMKPRTLQFTCRGELFHGMIAILFLRLLPPVHSQTPAQQADSQVMTTATSDTQQAPKLPNDQLDSLVAPIALYPDPLLAQTLAASTYPLEVIQLQQWMDRNKNLQGKALADAVAKQPWDPSVQALVATPDVVQR